MANDQRKELNVEFSRAKAYSDEYRDGSPIAHLFNTRLKRVTELLEGFNAGRILDLGCGPALIAESFRQKGIAYYGLDLSLHMVQECLNHYSEEEQFRFSLGSIDSLPFAADKFDVVLCLGALEYVRDIEGALAEVSRVLKTRGVFIVTMQNPMSPYRVWQRFVYWKARNVFERIANVFKKPDAKSEHKQGYSRHFKLLREDDLRQLTRGHGMKIEDVLYYDFNIFPSPTDKMFSKFSTKVSRKLEVLARGKLKFLGTGYIFKCRNK